MTAHTMLIGAPEWLIPAATLGVVALLAVILAYWHVPGKKGIRALAAVLKVLGFAGLVLCLLEPLVSAVRPRKGANLFVLLTDNSQSLTMRNPGTTTTRGEDLVRLLDQQTSWQTRLRQDFDVRSYAFDRRIRPLESSGDLTFTGVGSAVSESLQTLAQRFRNRPVAGILLFTDGITSDEALDISATESLPPIFPVLVSSNQDLRDLAIGKVSVTQTNFEETPVTIAAEIERAGFAATPLTVELRSESGELLETELIAAQGDEASSVARFEFRPAAEGVAFYELRVREESQNESWDAGKSDEATLVNNRRFVAVRRRKGPYRVLYVAGRPNWEFKFLRRAVQADNEVQLVGLVRVAKREARFDFRGHLNEETNPLYRGFGNRGNEQAEQYDEPVLLRLGTRDAAELSSGFPSNEEELFTYDAIILDDVEAGFFSPDQLVLIHHFVGQRGGGFMMLGGQESFNEGDYRHTPIAELLPVYLEGAHNIGNDDRYRIVATREGMLQPWTRLRATESAERIRFGAMPPMHIMNRLDSIKPGATALSFARDSSGEEFPTLVSQQFGAGRVLALTIGDMWRWNLQRQDKEPPDAERAWRQTIRWLVADVPRRVEVDIQQRPGDAIGTVVIRVTARDVTHHPLDNASVTLRVSKPNGQVSTFVAPPSEAESGTYVATYVPDETGVYRCEVEAFAADGSQAGTTVSGWTSDPQQAEFSSLRPRREMFAQLAKQTGGELVTPDNLDRFVRDLPQRSHLTTETWVYPFWHQWWVLAAIVACFVGEWALRRWTGLA